MTKRLLEIAAEIVQGQASVVQMSPDQIELALFKTFTILQKMKKAEDEGIPLDLTRPSEPGPAEEKAPDKINPKDSIQEDKVICLECGAKMKQLTAKHLGSHGLGIREYRQKWGFPLKQSLSAKALSRARSKAAKKRGLPENLVKYQLERKLKKAESLPAGAPAKETPAPEAQKTTKTRAKRSRASKSK